ncbi:MAG: outer membrane beta-barrel protein, partial [Sphingobacteriales bacterium]|nr:outer membrane beta-barrel protein [Sphingobacteriales bacterium]
ISDYTNKDHFKKYKLATTYLEVPLELRYTAHPEKENKSWKFAAGIKVGFLLNAHTKGKTLQYQNGSSNNFVEKINTNRFFNTTRVSGTARIGYGHYSLFGSYSLTTFLKNDNADIRPYQIGITLSGL